jgi:hypothetical protein
MVNKMSLLLRQIWSNNLFFSLGTWNRLIFELVQAQPTEFGTGLCSGRVWINGVSTPRTYFCDFSSGYDLFADMDNAKIELCSREVSGEPGVLDNTTDSYSDIVDFMWFKGAEGLFTNTSGTEILQPIS